MNEYYWKLIEVIEDLRGSGWEYKEVAGYLNNLGYRSRRGKLFYGNLVERIHKKYLAKLENEKIRDIRIHIK